MDKINKNVDASDLEIARLVDRLLRRIHGSLHVRAPEFDVYGVGQSGGLLLLTLAEEAPVGPGTLSTMLARDKSQITRMVASLERKGLVQREADPKDARVSLLSLTDKGRDAVHRIRVATAEVLSGILAPVSAKERAALREMLSRI